jgi:hypothetical protein
LRQSTVIRPGFGIYYGTLDSYDQSAVWHNGPPDYSEITFGTLTDRLYTPAMIVPKGFPTGLFPSTTVPRNAGIYSTPTY